MCAEAIEVELTDDEPSFDRRQAIRVVADHQGVSIDPEGYGDFGSAEGQGSPMFLYLHEDRLRLVVWADINQENPTHVIDLDGAREVRRK